MNFERARVNMVEQQIRPWEVLDRAVLDLMERAPRDAFVPEEYRRLAYADVPVPIGEGEVMLPPRLEGRLLQALGIEARAGVLKQRASAEQAREIDAALRRLTGAHAMGALSKALALAHPALGAPPGFEPARGTAQ